MSRIERNPKVYYRICNSPQPPPVQSQINPVHVLIPTPSYFLKVHFNIILSFTPMSSNCPPILRLPHEKHACTSHFPIRATWSANLSSSVFRTKNPSSANRRSVGRQCRQWLQILILYSSLLHLKDIRVTVLILGISLLDGCIHRNNSYLFITFVLLTCDIFSDILTAKLSQVFCHVFINLLIFFPTYLFVNCNFFIKNYVTGCRQCSVTYTFVDCRKF